MTPDTPQTTASVLDFVGFFKAFCNTTRARIIDQLLDGEKCVCELTAQLNISQPLISHHLATLRASGFVLLRNEGSRTYYAIDWDTLEREFADFSALIKESRQRPTSARSIACA
jgi:ArsR family transcriptional regulator